VFLCNVGFRTWLACCPCALCMSRFAGFGDFFVGVKNCDQGRGLDPARSDIRSMPACDHFVLERDLILFSFGR